MKKIQPDKSKSGNKKIATLNSDKSQPIKILLGLLILGSIVYFGIKLTNQPRNFGQASEGVGYGILGTTVTNTTVVCPGGASALIVATGTGRTSFAVSLPFNATNSVTICKAGTCVAGASGYLLASSTAGRITYEQQDSYIGSYSCIGGASTTVGVSYSQ